MIADFSGDFQNTVTLKAPGAGTIELTGDLTQTAAPGFTLLGRRHRFGHRRRLAHVTVTGQATLTDPTVPRAVHYFAGFVSDSGGVSS
jgi:hypothetical protein